MPYRNSVRRFLWADIKWLLVWVAIGALIGSLFDRAIYGVVLGLLAFMVRQWRALYLLNDWIKHHKAERPPEVSGILSELSASFYHVYKTEMRLREALMNNIRRARESVSALEEAVVLVDKNSSIEWWNPAAERILGLKNGDQGLNILNLIRTPAFIHYFKAEDYRISLKIASPFHANRFLQFEITPFGNNDKLMIVDDITRINQLEQVRKDFIANVSHELKTPITVFKGYVENFIDQPDLKPAWQRAFGQMYAQAQRMNNIVDDLLMLSRLESETDSVAQTPVNMPDLLTRLFDDAQAYNLDYGHLINLNIGTQKGVLGSEKELESAFGNLIFNAIKYTPKGGEITIEWQHGESGVFFRVSDNGIGIPEQHIDRLTERFYRVDAGRSRKTGGTGLGLAIVKHVALRHGATLSIDSVLEKGSVFTILFPQGVNA